MREAVCSRETVFETAVGNHITIRSRHFASLARRHLLCIDYEVFAERPCQLQIRTGIDGDVWDINGPHLQEMTSGEQEGVISLTAVTHENHIPIAVCEAIAPPHPCTITSQQTGTFREFDFETGIRFQKFVAHFTGLDEGDVEENGRSLCQEAASIGFEALLAEHTALWAERWHACDVQIEGDEAAQQALRFSMYHLLAIVPAHTHTASIPARGMSGQMYKGAIFWDTEIFMLPFFTHTLPNLARNLLLYRYQTLDGARRKAQEYGYRGAFYAWESQDSGDDACTLFNITDVFTDRPMRTYFRDKQIHISADVVYAFWQYFSLTSDASIWLDGGAEVVFECARFFLSYIYFHPDSQRYELLDVTGPDEYHERVHNNAFTNRMVAHTLEGCLQLADHLQQTAPDFLADLVTRLNFEADMIFMSKVVNKLYRPDTTDEIIPQFDGYFSLENVPLKTLLQRKLNPHEYLGGGSGLATSTQIIKQADVVLMLYLFGDDYSRHTKAANWEYYEPRTEHGSSLSACSYSLIAAQIGKVAWAYKYFMKTATIDMTGIGKQYVGTLYIGGTHPAGNGGTWMAAVLGLCGIRCVGDTVFVDAHLPETWNKVTLPLTFQGQKLRLTLTKTDVTVERVTPATKSLSISVNETVYLLPKSGEMKVGGKTAVVPSSQEAALA
jgi:trehalose/maltose hydrolase-like predicted phosphorylase